MTPALETSALYVFYGERPVLNGVDLRVDPAEVAVVLGGSGCGKSTLLRAAIGLVQPRSGHVRLWGHDLFALEEEDRQALRRDVGVVFQQGALFGSLTVAGNVALPLQMHADLPAAVVDEVVAGLLSQVGLEDAGGLYPAELSGGMRKRAAVARALALEPRLLLCDEPAAGLDPVAAAGIDALLLDLNQRRGTTIVVITHELLSIERLEGRLTMLEQGRVAFTGSVDEARRCPLPAVERFFHPGLRR
jgi:phospholipid/cholesterol/gamma-HCH transport system ATP-binding protein